MIGKVMEEKGNRDRWSIIKIAKDPGHNRDSMGYTGDVNPYHLVSLFRKRTPKYLRSF